MTTKRKLIFEIERRMEMYKDKEKDGRKHKDFFWEGYFMGAGKALASMLRYVESIMEDKIEHQGIFQNGNTHWKPSEEQIATLEQWLKDKQFDGASRYVYPIFESLLEHLKRIRYD